MTTELEEFKYGLLLRRVASRFTEAMEHSSPEAMKEYLKEHPNADKSKHTVKKDKEEKGKDDTEGESSKGLPKGVDSWHDLSPEHLTPGPSRTPTSASLTKGLDTFEEMESNPGKFRNLKKESGGGVAFHGGGEFMYQGEYEKPIFDLNTSPKNYAFAKAYSAHLEKELLNKDLDTADFDAKPELFAKHKELQSFLTAMESKVQSDALTKMSDHVDFEKLEKLPNQRAVRAFVSDLASKAKVDLDSHPALSNLKMNTSGKELEKMFGEL